MIEGAELGCQILKARLSLRIDGKTGFDRRSLTQSWTLLPRHLWLRGIGLLLDNPRSTMASERGGLSSVDRLIGSRPAFGAYNPVTPRLAGRACFERAL